ncbi:hypothetical protein ACSBR1_033063 [Camellia fascicularis]
MVKAVKLLVASLSSSSRFITLYTSRTRSLRPIATSAAASSNLRLHIARASSTSTHTHKANEFGALHIRTLQNYPQGSLLLHRSLLRHGQPPPCCSWREVKRFVDLTAEETVDMWLTVQKVGSRLENYHKASSLTLTIQDGPQAGQTVPHVHIHILPRKSGDFEKSDDVYDAIDEKEKELKQKLDLDKERKDRTLEEMSEEADEYRRLLS